MSEKCQGFKLFEVFEGKRVFLMIRCNMQSVKVWEANVLQAGYKQAEVPLAALRSITDVFIKNRF